MTTNKGRGSDRNGLPGPVNVIVVLVLLGYLGYALIVLGAEGLPFAYVIGTLLGAYAGVDQLLRHRGSGSGGGKE